MKKLVFLISILFLISCNNEYNSLDFKDIQRNYSLLDISDELSKDTLNFTAKLYHNKKFHYPNHGFLVMLNKEKDTILKYFGDASVISNSYIFKKNSDYFIHFNKKHNNRFFYNNKFYQIDTLQKTIVDIEQLDKDIFNKFFKSEIGIEGSNQLHFEKLPDNDFILRTNISENDTLYGVECSLEFLKKNDGHYKFSANPKKLNKIALQNQEVRDKNLKKNIAFGEIGGYELVYNCSNCRTSSTDAISIYAKKDTVKTKLFDYFDFGGNYLDEISLRYFKNHPFIYIHTTHTYGHSNGDLYAFDIENLKTNKVNTIESNTKVPDSLQPWKWFGLAIENNEFLTGGDYRSKNNSSKYVTSAKYNLIKVKKNIYLLEPENVDLEYVKYQ